MKKRLFKVLYILVIVILLCAFVICLWKLVDYFWKGKQSQDAYKDLSNLVQQGQDPTGATVDWNAIETMPDEQAATIPSSPYVSVTHPETGAVTLMLPEFEELFAINPDIVGWISMPNINVDYPVVQRKSETDYYLYRDFYGKFSLWGCIYVREQCDVFDPSDNIVIYGHRMQDGTMFADLIKYTDKDYWEENQFIQFNTLRARHRYQIICVFNTTATVDEGFPYHLFVDAEYDSDLDKFWNNCRNNAYFDTGLEPHYGDKLITLSTCEYSQPNGRLVVVAKRVD